MTREGKRLALLSIWALVIFFGFAICIYASSEAYSLRKYNKLKKECSESMEAVITGNELEQRRDINWFIGDKKYYVFNVTYTYTVNGQDYRGSILLNRKKHHSPPEGTIKVYYDPDSPDIHYTPYYKIDNGAFDIFIMRLFGLMLIAGGGFMMFWTYKWAQKRWWDSEEEAEGNELEEKVGSLPEENKEEEDSI